MERVFVEDCEEQEGSIRHGCGIQSCCATPLPVLSGIKQAENVRLLRRCGHDKNLEGFTLAPRQD